MHRHYWWTYSYQGVRYCRIELLVWTSHEDECVAKISKCGNYFYFMQKLPERFTDMARLFSYYDAAHLVGDLDTCADAIVEQGVNLQNQVAEAFELNTVTPVIKMKLPFTAQQTFEDPYRPAMLGYELSSYPHERGLARNFFVFSACVRDASVPHQKLQTEIPSPGMGPTTAAAATSHSMRDVF
jgi:hypothetical protein